jgi:hypothetical protein
MLARVTLTVRVPQQLAKLVNAARGDETLNAFLSAVMREAAERSMKRAARGAGKLVRRGKR